MVTQIEILREPLDEEVLRGQVMGPGHEVLVDGEWIRAVRRATGRDDLFVYHHRMEGTFVVAQWLCKEPRICQELEVMETPPDRGGWIALQMMQMRCVPAAVHHRKIREIIRGKRVKRKDLRLSSLGEKTEVVKWLKRKGDDASAAFVNQGRFTGTEEGGDALGETKDRLKSAAAEKLITHR